MVDSDTGNSAMLGLDWSTFFFRDVPALVDTEPCTDAEFAAEDSFERDRHRLVSQVEYQMQEIRFCAAILYVEEEHSSHWYHRYWQGEVPEGHKMSNQNNFKENCENTAENGRAGL